MPRIALLALSLILTPSLAWAADSKPPRWFDPNAIDPMDVPSSTIPGCLNRWTGPGTGETCEGKAARTAWEERHASVVVALNTLTTASSQPERADVRAVANALAVFAMAADAADANDPVPKPPAGRRMQQFLAWLRQWCDGVHQPVPASGGEFFRRELAVINDPNPCGPIATKSMPRP